MIRCNGCNRHIFATETACPFCTAPRRRVRNGLLAAGLAVLSGCPAYGAPPERLDAGSDAAIATDATIADQGMTDATVDMAGDAEVDMPIALPPYGIPPGEE